MKVMTIEQERIFRHLQFNAENKRLDLSDEKINTLVANATPQQITNARYSIEQNLLPSMDI